MIELIREAAWLVLTWCIGLTITYGVVESVLFLPVRILLSSEGESGWWLETLLYCPACTGFWVFGATGAVSYLSGWWFIYMAAIGVASLLVARAMGVALVVPHEDVEGPGIEKARELRKGAS